MLPAFASALATAGAAGTAWARAAGPWLALLLRLAAAQSFLLFQLRSLMLGDSGTAAGRAEALFAALAHSGVGGTIQALCPVLLALGLLSRLAAAAMLLQALLLPMSAEAAGLPLLWSILLGWVVVSGPGPLSVDRALSPAARSSALPALGAATRLFAWMRATLAPLYLLAIRLALATSLAGLWLTPAAMPRGGAAMQAMQGVARIAPGAWPLVAGLLLAAGLATRPLALLLAVSGGLGLAGAMHDAAAVLAWLLLASVLVVYGGGPLSLDGVLAGLARAYRAARPLADMPHVVIVGGGFGGITAAHGLRHAACRVTLVDRRNHHLFQPLLYQVATAGLSPSDIATPIREMVRGQANVRVLLGEVTGADPARKTLQLGRGELPYDYLVLATGAQHGYFGHDTWSGLAPGLKTIADATAIRGRVLRAFEAAESTDDAAERAACLTFVVVGGGPTGVELAGAIAELARFGLEGEFRAIDPGRARVVLVQAGPRLLPAFPPGLSADAERALRHLGVEVRLDARVEDVSAAGAIVSGEALPARTVLWAAGVTASPAARWLGAPADAAGRVIVAGDLSVPGAADVFAIGDTAASLGWNGAVVPGLAPAAKQGGVYVARLIAARLAGRPAIGPFRYRHFGSLATIGRQSAVADFGRIRLRGALAWWLWGAAHIAFLVGGRNRALVLTEWLWAYLTFRRGTRLIIDPA